MARGSGGSGEGSVPRVESSVDAVSTGSVSAAGGGGNAASGGGGQGVQGVPRDGGGGAGVGADGGGGGRTPRWTVGAAVAGRLEEMRARELGASLRAKVQENEAMKRYLDSVKVCFVRCS